ncbi:DUF5605 domain-containing protein [Paenibacillus radicis (ex Xue et al. 2023)]|uniref:DUF5605 domain-containing protein n=1 Tax=Paenibacillus radicis (ex Xue et al. 2023) TaxID=2972489 RepID=A0ABT1YDI6_9BACL|nr:DUF5060 domain-containing protein [Paenibacillus radicis (ex Xue et al. 2023)]MCR8631249.1 DUF5605 domain-containing protein [Paenibacillus radicis (ex Xue et al. 2023)]
MELNLTNKVERWGIYELMLNADESCAENFFSDIRLSAQFEHQLHTAEAEGFYDGNGQYCIRYMPRQEGVWKYRTSSNHSKLDGLIGEFTCTEASSDNHGPIEVKDHTHFQYADGTPYTPIGTNCYNWHQQSEQVQELTLRSLGKSPFNKVRMNVSPTADLLNRTYFSHLEERIQELAVLGIQAELMLFQSEDGGMGGINRLSPEEEERYLRYVIARLGAYRNIWWSFVNEPDDNRHNGSKKDWNRLARIIKEYDYGSHLLTILSPHRGYDFGAPWITHVSIKHTDVRVASDYTKQYAKPVIIEECGCEGNLDTRLGSLTPEELVCRIWEGHLRGGHVTHGETYLGDDELLWQLHGGELRGQSVQRIEFMQGILEDAPHHMTYSSDRLDAATLEVRGEYYLQYFGPHRFAFREFALPEGKYQADVIDTWNMTIAPLTQLLEGRFRINLPGKLYHALRIRKVSGCS